MTKKPTNQAEALKKFNARLARLRAERDEQRRQRARSLAFPARTSPLPDEEPPRRDWRKFIDSSGRVKHW
jgi:hypothetical protein